MNLGKQIAEGAGHKVYEHESAPTLLVKIPKPGMTCIPFDDMESDLNIARERFGNWLAKTEIEKDSDGSYIIVQEKVEHAKHITPKDLERKEIRQQIEEILKTNRHSLQQDGVGLDFIGLEGSAKCVLSNQKKWKGGAVDKWLITPILKGALLLKQLFPKLLIPEQVLDWWNDEALTSEITNIIIGEKEGREHVYIVDPSLVHNNAESRKEKVRTAILQLWNRRFLKKNFDLDL